MNEVIGRTIETVNAPIELKRQEAEKKQENLIAENDILEVDINQVENNIISLKAQLVPGVAAAATELDTNIVRDETPAVAATAKTLDATNADDTAPVAATAKTLDATNADDTAPVAAGETIVSQDGEWTNITTSDGAQINTNVGANGDEVIYTDPNGEQIRIHGDPHIDFNNDGEDDVHTGDNFQIETSGGSIIHFNTVKEGEDWYTRGIFVEDQNGTVTQVGRSANDKDHIDKATEVDKSAISQLGSDDDGAAVLGIAEDGTGMIKQGNDWYEVEDESFKDFKENMSFADQIGKKIDPDFVGAETQGVALDIAETNSAGVDTQLDESAINIAAQNAAIEQEIDNLEGEVQILNAKQGLNDQDIKTAAAVEDNERAKLSLNENMLQEGNEVPDKEFKVSVIDSDVDADIITDKKKDVNSLGQG